MLAIMVTLEREVVTPHHASHPDTAQQALSWPLEFRASSHVVVACAYFSDLSNETRADNVLPLPSSSELQPLYLRKWVSHHQKQSSGAFLVIGGGGGSCQGKLRGALSLQDSTMLRTVRWTWAYDGSGGRELKVRTPWMGKEKRLENPGSQNDDFNLNIFSFFSSLLQHWPELFEWGQTEGLIKESLLNGNRTALPCF